MLVIRQRITNANIQKLIDFIKIEITNFDTIKAIQNNPILTYIKRVEKYNKDAEIYYIYYYTYQNLKFDILTDSNRKPKRLYITGSLHYYFNKGLHNANDFTYINFIGVVNKLITIFKINPYQSILRSLEYGINIEPLAYSTRTILQNTFYHQRKKFLEPINKPYKQSGTPKQHNYILKIYDKAFQFPNHTKGELLRFEIKYSRMRELNTLGIVFLSDLFPIENNLKLYTILKKRFTEVLFYDFTINTKKLTPAKQKNAANYSNINYWDNIINDIKKGQKNRNNFTYHKKQLKTLILKHSKQVQQKLSYIIDNKGVDLLNLARYTGFEKVKHSAYTHPVSKKKCSAYTHLYIGCIPFHKYLSKTELKKERKCIITGVDISMQKQDSNLLSHTGLKYYFKTDKNIFEKVKRKYLTSVWYDADFETQIKEISHNIRNYHNNQKLKQIKLYPTHQMQLFELN